MSTTTVQNPALPQEKQQRATISMIPHEPQDTSASPNTVGKSPKADSTKSKASSTHAATHKTTRSASPPGSGEQDPFAPFMKLLEDETTVEQTERQISVLNRILRSTPKGFSVRSAILGVPEAVEICARQLAQGHTGFVLPLCELLRKCAEPLIATKLQDELKMKTGLISVMNAVASALNVSNTAIRETAAQTVEQITIRVRDDCGDDLSQLLASSKKINLGVDTFEGSLQSFSSQQQSFSSSKISSGSPSSIFRKYDKKLLQHQALMESNIVPVIAAQFQPKTLTNTDLRFAILRAIRELSAYSQACEAFTNEGCFERLLNTLATADFHDPLVTYTVEIVWNVLELYPPSKSLASTLTTITALRDLMRALFVDGYRLRDKEFRNDCLVVCSLLAAESVNHDHFYESGFTEILFIVACGLEQDLTHELLERIKGSLTSEDFELKRLLWNLLYALSFSNSNAQYLLDAGMLNVLLSYLDSKCTNTIIVKWPAIQLMDLQHQALNVVCQLALFNATYFAEASGAVKLLGFLRDSMDLALRNTTLRIVVHLANSSNSAALVQAGAIGQLLDLIRKEADLNVQRDCFQAISDMCTGEGPAQDQAREHFLSHGGTSLLVPLIHSDLRDPSIHPLVHVVVDCTWNAIVGRAQNERSFFEYQGICALLNLLDRQPPEYIQLCALSALVDFFNNPDAVTQALKWESDNTGRYPVHKLLTKIWLASPEEPIDPVVVKTTVTRLAKLPCSRESNSTIPFSVSTLSVSMASSPTSPASPVSANATYGGTTTIADQAVGTDDLKVDANDAPPPGYGTPPPASAEQEILKSADVKTKVYCLFKKIGFEPHTSLDFDGKKAMVAIAAHIDSRRDRMWEFIELSLKQQGIRPTSADRLRLAAIEQARSQRQETIAQGCSTINSDAAVWLQEDETTFYRSLIRKSDNKEALLKSAGRKTLTITQAKLHKVKMLEESLKKAAEDIKRKKEAEEAAAAAAAAAQAAAQAAALASFNNISPIAGAAAASEYDRRMLYSEPIPKGSQTARNKSVPGLRGTEALDSSLAAPAPAQGGKRAPATARRPDRAFSTGMTPRGGQR